MQPLDSYPRLLAHDVTALAAFYSDGLGLVPARTVADQYVSFDLHAGTPAESTALAILAADEIAAEVGTVGAAEPTRDRLMVVLRVADVDACVPPAVAAGGTLVAGPTDKAYGLRSAHLRDPEGNLVEIQQY
ncbi:VOC family protein [Actinocatenispora rupis]|uniref:Extradiol dioxygenase n=1 Tax=Actinocatenispora rupis TaxID=519421 RepID=A0A8J3NCL4_9ACTN|nr:VOC family protein [Actinocatenispora rupis]GID12020.1 extradiol dioxygenase [Actinocatenispora rupis]